MKLATRTFLLVLVMNLGFGIAAVTPASAITFNWLFSPTLGTATDGTITFANVNDISPTAFSFAVSGITITDSDDTLEFTTQWAFGQPTSVDAEIVHDLTQATLSLGSGDPGVYVLEELFGPEIGRGSYTFTAVPEPSTAMLLGLGAGLLAIRRRPGRHEGQPKGSLR